MELMVFIVGPPLVTFLILVGLPSGMVALMGHGIALFLWATAAAAIYPLRPRSGPDDWFHGIELVPLWGTFAVILAVGMAQLWRWQRKRSGQKAYYMIALAVFGFASAAGLLPIIGGF